MAKTKTRPWDAAEHLTSENDIVAYLDAALEEGDAALVVAALDDIARAKGMTTVARQAGLGRGRVGKALSGQRNPTFAAVLEAVRSLGLQLHAKAG